MPVVACLHHLDQPFLGLAAEPFAAAGLRVDERCVPAGDPLPRLGEFTAFAEVVVQSSSGRFPRRRVTAA